MKGCKDMLPKVIHYCWFGGNKLPISAVKCINSWKKFFPDYEIKEWNETNYDVRKIPYIAEAYDEKKYAFVSDYARFDILYQFGGLYFDTDVEVIKKLDDIIAQGPFMGFETDAGNTEQIDFTVAPGLGLGVNPGLGLYKDMLDLYASLHFKNSDETLNTTTIVVYTTEMLKKAGLKNQEGIQNVAGITIYPSEYFCPISVRDGKLRITPQTRTIHHYDQSWQSPVRKYGRKVVLALGGEKLKKIIKKLYKN